LIHCERRDGGEKMVEVEMVEMAEAVEMVKVL